MMKCIICERRPARKDCLCASCNDKINHERTARASNEAKYFLTYHGQVVGLYPSGNAMLKARLLNRSDSHLPKRKTIDLNHYCDGYTRQVIKAFKACVLQLTSA